jgi:DNA-binding LacI/PurR family transcriptional regulator
MSITIKDLAKLANVSHTTVSRALNNSPLIHKETKEKIQKLAMQMNYIPNINAKSLVLHRSYNIGLFFSTLDSGTSAVFFHDVVRGVNHIIKDQYNLIVKGIDDYKSFQSISTRSFDGIIVMSQSAGDNPFIEYVIEQNIPQVVLNRSVDYEEVSNILSDDYSGAEKVVKHLIENGHHKIGLIEGKSGFHSTKERSSGYFSALEQKNIQASPEYQVKGNYDVESGYTAMNRLLALKSKPTAIFCSNDDMAVGAIKAITEQGLNVPEDISIVGFDDNVFSAFLTPALTTVKRPIEKISQEGAKRLILQLESKDVQMDTLYMNTDIILRQSVKKISQCLR